MNLQGVNPHKANTAIRLFVTGGTFDKNYDYLRGELFFDDTQVPEMLRLGRSTLDVRLRTLMMVDSLDMTREDRELIARNCATCEEDLILVTHGTDTMVDTASMVAQSVKNKTIVFTGAMVPYRFGSSDGFFNLGSALAFVQVLPPGVYIVMNGRYFTCDNVRKNKKTGFFEELR
ncbi:MAG: asparaginase [Bacteroidetes bacterium]|nr:MAG: asparaginase [Bacteroidota bacterium]